MPIRQGQDNIHFDNNGFEFGTAGFTKFILKLKKLLLIMS